MPNRSTTSSRASRRGDAYFLINGLGSVNNFIGGIVLKPWEQRKRSQHEIQQEIQGKLGEISGINAFSVNFPALPGASQGGVSFVVSSTDDYKTIHGVTQKILDAARKSGMFYYVDTDLKFNSPQLNIDIDRNKAQQLGISMQDAANTLSLMLGGGYLNFFNLQGRSYKVIPQVADKVPRERRPAAAVLRADRRRQHGAPVHHRHRQQERGAGPAQPVPAAQLRHHQRLRQRHHGQGRGLPERSRPRSIFPPGLLRELRGGHPPVRHRKAMPSW